MALNGETILLEDRIAKSNCLLNALIYAEKAAMDGFRGWRLSAWIVRAPDLITAVRMLQPRALKSGALYLRNALVGGGVNVKYLKRLAQTNFFASPNTTPAKASPLAAI